MMRRPRPAVIAAAIALIVLAPLAAVFAGKLTLNWLARSKAAALSVGAASMNSEQRAEMLTRLVHREFVDSNGAAPVVVYAARLFSRQLVPGFLRYDAGAIDLLYMRGACDSAARALAYLLQQNGLEAAQLNLVLPAAAHSVTLAVSERGPLLLDAFYGVVPRLDGHIVGPEVAQAHLQKGLVWTTFEHKNRPPVYDQFATARFARQGERLEFEAVVRMPPEGRLQLGKDNGLPSDVEDAGSRAGLTPYWSYLGSRYDRAWVRILCFAQDTAVVIKPVLPPQTKFITTSAKPTIKDGRLIFHLRQGERLRFEDGRAGYDFWRLRSYQDIDSISFAAEGTSPAPGSDACGVRAAPNV